MVNRQLRKQDVAGRTRPNTYCFVESTVGSQGRQGKRGETVAWVCLSKRDYWALYIGSQPKVAVYTRYPQ